MNEQKIQSLMSALKITREEAIDVIESDEKIDKGEKLFELEGEAKQIAKQACQSDRKPNKEKVKRERKIDNDKHELFTLIYNSISDYSSISNPDRELEIIYNNKKFKLVLTQTRT